MSSSVESNVSSDEKLGEIKALLTVSRDDLREIKDSARNRQATHEGRFTKLEERLQSIESTIQKIATRDELVKSWSTPIIKGLKIVGKIALVLTAAIIISRYPGAIDAVAKILSLFGL